MHDYVYPSIFLAYLLFFLFVAGALFFLFEGDGLVCHEGTVSCFTRPITLNTDAKEGTNA